uniref:Small ribosomal subunit protein uS15c n=1 Tax=Acrostichum speciosum TaxID=366450 RepID=A0A7M1VKX3_9MONI|nr:ribosomal protein S15 [Acrostichum speciosum]QOS04123.1 ribosomal protein S15 [Acrostichum speciosum]
MNRQASIESSFLSENQNTGLTAFQIYYLTYRISKLTFHLELHPKDYSSQIGLWKLLGKRKRLLNYLSDKNMGLYVKVLIKLGIRGLKGR